MAWKIWKKPKERADEEYRKAYKKGINLGDWRSAYNSLVNAIKLYGEAGYTDRCLECRALACLCLALMYPERKKYWVEASKALRALGGKTISFPKPVNSLDLALECDLRAMELEIKELKSEEEKAKALMSLAQRYNTIKRDLLLVSILQGVNQDGESRGRVLIARAYIHLGNSVLDRDPLKAAEYYRMASLQFSSIGFAREAEDWDAKSKRLQEVRECWVCGRKVVGRDVNFIVLEGRITGYLAGMESGKTLKTFSDEGIVVCIACSSIITTIADRIAKAYYEKMMRALEETRRELLKRIERLESRISRLEWEVRMSRR